MWGSSRQGGLVPPCGLFSLRGSGSHFDGAHRARPVSMSGSSRNWCLPQHLIHHWIWVPVVFYRGSDPHMYNIFVFGNWDCFSRRAQIEVLSLCLICSFLSGAGAKCSRVFVFVWLSGTAVLPVLLLKTRSCLYRPLCTMVTTFRV